jgi:thiamine biosynthesis lipoprotein ApbE
MRADGLATAAMIHGTDAMAFIQSVSGIEGIVINSLARHPGKVLVYTTPGLHDRVELLDRSAEFEH